MSDEYSNYTISRGKSYEGDEDVTRITITVQTQGSTLADLDNAVELLDSVVGNIKHGL